MIQFLFALALLSFTNDSDWKSKLQEAHQFQTQGSFYLAAQSFESAWLMQESEIDLLISAGDAYMHARRYDHAVRVYEEALLDGANTNFIQYKLGLALKQNGQYTSAIEQFSESLQTEVAGSYLLSKMIKKEIDGCQMALAHKFVIEGARINHMGSDINSAGTDYAPLSSIGNTLYFASNKSGKAKLYQSVLLNGSWTTPAESKELKGIIRGTYGGGTFNKDKTEFYFSVCDEVPTASAAGNNCKIHKSIKRGSAWGSPIALREYINWSGASTTHPSLVYEGDTEVLYFSSNREGGQGGMDIWYATREINSTDIDFTFPINAGPVVNTLKDDLTPFYDRSSGTMYFSSNGHVSAGGLDVFKAIGNRNEWTSPSNMGAPINSSSDDYYYNVKVGTEKAFLTSNRLLDNGQKTTADDDIFELDFSPDAIASSTTPITSTGTVTRNNPTTNSADFRIKGRITDSSNGSVLGATYVTLYRAIGETQRKKVETIKTNDGKYNFGMTAGEYYIVEAYKPGYQVGDFEFNTEDLESGVSLDISLERSKGYTSKTKITGNTTTATAPESSSIPSANYSPRTVSTPPTRTTTSLPSSKTDKTYDYSSDEVVAGTKYRIQLTAVGKYNPMLPIFSKARQYGSLGTEIHPNGKLTRVFLSSFNSYNQAKDLVGTMKGFGFDTAFVVKYVNGRRITL